MDTDLLPRTTNIGHYHMIDTHLRDLKFVTFLGRSLGAISEYLLNITQTNLHNGEKDPFPWEVIADEGLGYVRSRQSSATVTPLETWVTKCRSATI